MFDRHIAEIIRALRVRERGYPKLVGVPGLFYVLSAPQRRRRVD